MQLVKRNILVHFRILIEKSRPFPGLLLDILNGFMQF